MSLLMNLVEYLVWFVWGVLIVAAALYVLGGYYMDIRLYKGEWNV